MPFPFLHVGPGNASAAMLPTIWNKSEQTEYIGLESIRCIGMHDFP